MAIADDDTIAARWPIGLTADGWEHVSTIAQLAAKWNDLATQRGKTGNGRSHGRRATADDVMNGLAPFLGAMID